MKRCHTPWHFQLKTYEYNSLHNVPLSIHSSLHIRTGFVSLGFSCCITDCKYFSNGITTIYKTKNDDRYRCRVDSRNDMIFVRRSVNTRNISTTVLSQISTSSSLFNLHFYQNYHHHHQYSPLLLPKRIMRALM